MKLLDLTKREFDRIKNERFKKLFNEIPQLKKEPIEEQKALGKELINKGLSIAKLMQTEEGKKKAQKLLDLLKVRLFKESAVVPMHRKFEIFLQEAKRLKREGKQKEAEAVLLEAKELLRDLILRSKPEEVKQLNSRFEDAKIFVEGELEEEEEGED